MPEWIQDSEIPDLGDGNMRFLCQLKSDYNNENSGITFGDDGDLFVFYDTVYKMLHYRIQNT